MPQGLAFVKLLLFYPLLNTHILAILSQSVTLGDEEASRRGVQKTVLERKGPSTFSCGVEIISKTKLRVHRNLDATVDAILSGFVFHLHKIIFPLQYSFPIF